MLRWPLFFLGGPWLFIVLFAYPFLAYEDNSGSVFLVVEGWQSDQALKAAAIEFQSGSYQKLITTGGRMTSSQYLKVDHELRFTTLEEALPAGAELLINGSGIDHASFKIAMCGEDGWETPVTGEPQQFKYTLPCAAQSISLISENSGSVDSGTQNLFIKYVWVGRRNILSKQVRAELWSWELDEATSAKLGTGVPLVIDHATKARNKLLALGISEDRIIVARGGGNGMHRTRQNAQGLNRKLESDALKGKDITLLTTGIHARRSRLLYERALGQDVGVMVVPDSRVSPAWWWLEPINWWRILRELGGCLYYWASE